MKILSSAKATIGDPFNEDVAELQFLRSKPTCFLIIGKHVSKILSVKIWIEI